MATGASFSECAEETSRAHRNLLLFDAGQEECGCQTSRGTCVCHRGTQLEQNAQHVPLG
jgi:hypothetical protein